MCSTEKLITDREKIKNLPPSIPNTSLLARLIASYCRLTLRSTFGRDSPPPLLYTLSSTPSHLSSSSASTSFEIDTMTSELNVQFASNGSLLNSTMNSATLPNAPPNLLSGSFSSHGPVPTNQQNAPTTQQPNILKLSNLPPDLTQREATLMFSLVIEDILSIELKDYSITAYFKNLNTCITTGKLLDGRYIFGNQYAPVKVDYDSNNALASTSSSFNNMRLSNPGISPPASHQLQHQVPPLAPQLLTQPPSLQPQQQPPQQPVQSAQPSASAGAGSQSFDNFQKRKSVGNQRSRFLFSDPFSGATTPTSNPAPGTIDLSDLTGKSLLMMESQSDAREYDNLVRDPWGSQNQSSMAFGSAPQTPGLSAVHNAFEWSSGSGASSGQQTQPPPQSSQQQPGSTSAQLAGTTSGASGADRRRTSSAFFNNANGSQAPSQSGSQSAQGQQPQTVAAILSQGPPLQSNGSLAPLSIPSSSINRNGPPSSGSNGQLGAPLSAGSSQQTETTPTSATRSNTKDVPDLSLLARVPPPANPADQNPPCNTLYVGNLPPDATEAELRTLFAPQKGFRRLSFRTKNQSSSSGAGSTSHNHGPMCFVEFEDVAHATIALAELYGRALPRPNGSNGKGGIRLSFSKNPLGVRGPGNPRRASTNQQPPANGSATNGVGNYGYLSFH